MTEMKEEHEAQEWLYNISTMMNLNRFNNSFGKVSYHIWRTITDNKPETENITVIEQPWIKIHGGLLWSREDNKYKKLYSYDINSFYPSLMIDKAFTYPVKQGTLMKIDNIKQNGYIKYGIYKLIVDDNNNPLFQKHENNLYTHYDIKAMDLLNINYQLDNTDDYNCVIYDKDRVNGRLCFSKYMDRMDKYKNDNVNHKFCKYIKQIKNALWGYMSINDGYGRLGIFLTSFGRLKLIELIHNNINDIVHINTDGFYTTTRIKAFDNLISDEIGRLKREKCENIYIKGKKIHRY